MKKIAFVGNPNVGKSALINAISGSNFKVGNWTGVTIEKKEAEFVYEGERYHFIDLPGIYSLDAKSKEEQITSDYLKTENVDLILNVVDSTNLERNLYLTMLLRELQKPMVLVLNFEDELEKMGYNLDLSKLSKFLNMPVVFTSATHKSGIDQLFHVIEDMYVKMGHLHHAHFEKDVNVDLKEILNQQEENSSTTNHAIYYGDEFDQSYTQIYNTILESKYVDQYKQHMSISKLSISLLENEDSAKQLIKDDQDLLSLVNKEIKKIEDKTGENSKSAIASYRYQMIHKLLEKVLKRSEISRLKLTKKIDDIFLNKYLGLPLFLFIAFLFMNIVIKGAAPFQDWVDVFANEFIGKYVGILIQNTPDWFQSLMLDGIIAGVGGVLTFIPLMAFLNFFLAILEETGYMARIAFLIDRIMKKLGINGRSFISMLLGFGCTVPAIYSTRTLGDEKSRKMTALMIPFMSCGAKLPVFSLLIAAFFGAQAGTMIFVIYLIGVIVAVLLAAILNKLGIFKNESQTFMIELPPYRIPTLKVLLKKVRFELKGYIQKTFTIIFAVLFILWGLAYFPNGEVETSYIATVGKTMQPVFEPTGFADDWRIVASIPGSIAAKETVVGFISQVFNNEEEVEEEAEETTFIEDLAEQGEGLVNAVKDSVIGIFDFSQAEEEVASGNIEALRSVWGNDALGRLKAFSFIIFILLLVPCIAAINAIRLEFGRKFTTYVIILTLVLPYITSVLIYQVGRLFI